MEDSKTKKQTQTRRVRGTGIYTQGSFTFKETLEGKPAQKDVKEVKGAKTYTTTGEKKPLRVAYLTCKADAADPYAEYLNQLESLGIKPLTPKKQSIQQRLMNEGGMEAWLNQSKGRLTYTGTIELGVTRNWQAELMRQMQLIVRRLPGEEKFNKLVNKLKKGVIQ